MKTEALYLILATGAISYRLAGVGGDTVAIAAHFGQNVTQHQGIAQNGLECPCFLADDKIYLYGVHR